jgi:hypothetical protein
MLSTSQIQENNGGGVKKTLSPGNIIARINDIQLVDGYNPGSKHLVLHLESEPVEGDFEGFLIDKDNPSAGRYQGQVGRVKYSRYAFEDGTTKSGYKKDRNIDCARAILELAKALSVAPQVNEIVVNIPDNRDMELTEFVKQARAILIRAGYMNFCIGGREWTNKNGYTEYDLFLPYEKGKIAFEKTDLVTGKLLSYDADKHIIAQKESKPVTNFEPVSSDFDI